VLGVQIPASAHAEQVDMHNPDEPQVLKTMEDRASSSLQADLAEAEEESALYQAAKPIVCSVYAMLDFIEYLICTPAFIRPLTSPPVRLE
jgi:hypothetical protein